MKLVSIEKLEEWCDRKATNSKAGWRNGDVGTGNDFLAYAKSQAVESEFADQRNECCTQFDAQFMLNGHGWRCLKCETKYERWENDRGVVLFRLPPQPEGEANEK